MRRCSGRGWNGGGARARGSACLDWSRAGRDRCRRFVWRRRPVRWHRTHYVERSGDAAGLPAERDNARAIRTAEPPIRVCRRLCGGRLRRRRHPQDHRTGGLRRAVQRHGQDEEGPHEEDADVERGQLWQKELRLLPIACMVRSCMLAVRSDAARMPTCPPRHEHVGITGCLCSAHMHMYIITYVFGCEHKWRQTGNPVPPTSRLARVGHQSPEYSEHSGPHVRQVSPWRIYVGKSY
mmetsp:Transcript_34874/g.69593  ORF Transcript_34874/g.69593 Transcript_34874/m.69593 type:complete len:237 (+) Transcript_34874:318-1028(+)